LYDRDKKEIEVFLKRRDIEIVVSVEINEK